MIFKPDEWDEILHKLISHFTSDFYSPQGTTEELGLTMDDTERLKQSILHIKENQKIQQLAMDHVYDTYYFRLFAPTRKNERIPNRRELFCWFWSAIMHKSCFRRKSAIFKDPIRSLCCTITTWGKWMLGSILAETVKPVKKKIFIYFLPLIVNFWGSNRFPLEEF